MKKRVLVWGLLLTAIAGATLWADIKISAMTSAVSLNDADFIPIVQAGANKKTTISLLRTQIFTGVTIGDVEAVGDCTSGPCFNGTAGNALQFEGSSADAHEITVQGANPGADVTVTIPATTGTLITTGDTGTVTRTMVATAARTEMGPTGDEHSVERPSTSLLDATTSDEFPAGENGSWGWCNQGTASASNGAGTSAVAGTTATELQLRGRCQTPPAGDWVITTRITPLVADAGAANGGAVGLAVIDAGTAGSPTGMKVLGVNWANNNSLNFYTGTKTSYTSAIGTFTTIQLKYPERTIPMCHQARFVDSGNQLTFAYAYDCLSWISIGSPFTLTNDPVSVIRYVDNNGNATAVAPIGRWWWWRVCVSGACLSTPYSPGS